MPWSADQRSIVRDSLLAIVVSAALLAAGYASCDEDRLTL